MKIKSYNNYINETKEAISLDTILSLIEGGYNVDADVAKNIIKFKGTDDDYQKIFVEIVKHDRIGVFNYLTSRTVPQSGLDKPTLWIKYKAMTNDYETLRILINYNNWKFVEQVLQRCSLFVDRIFETWIKSDEDYFDCIQKLFKHYYIDAYLNGGSDWMIFEQAYMLLFQSIAVNKIYLVEYFLEIIQSNPKYDICNPFNHIDYSTVYINLKKSKLNQSVELYFKALSDILSKEIDRLKNLKELFNEEMLPFIPIWFIEEYQHLSEILSYS